MLDLKRWLDELDDYDYDGGRLDPEEQEELFNTIMRELGSVAEKLEDEEASNLVYELIHVYENSGYYDFGGASEKERIRERLYEIMFK